MYGFLVDTCRYSVKTIFLERLTNNMLNFKSVLSFYNWHPLIIWTSFHIQDITTTINQYNTFHHLRQISTAKSLHLLKIFFPRSITTFFYHYGREKKVERGIKWNSVSSSRSSHRRFSVKKGVLRNFAKFTGKHLCQRLFFNKVAGLGLGSATLLKKRLWHRCFQVNFAKFLRTPFLIEHVWTSAFVFTTLFRVNITVRTRSNSTKKLYWLFTKEIIALR